MDATEINHKNLGPKGTSSDNCHENGFSGYLHTLMEGDVQTYTISFKKMTDETNNILKLPVKIKIFYKLVQTILREISHDRQKGHLHHQPELGQTILMKI